ncbi:hypothetical protein VIGAN_01089200 [Vigna angularis var. angularis]|uniref:Uncharacterized protein n=1 Tax=Vigna angularis var. angularis TaxID=157739 RepID=A0A0S3QYQ0_PHAAN|nr:hypothetical protein VIGAN_01089200 [Vigna angularis var. angularis]
MTVKMISSGARLRWWLVVVHFPQYTSLHSHPLPIPLPPLLHPHRHCPGPLLPPLHQTPKREKEKIKCPFMKIIKIINVEKEKAERCKKKTDERKKRVKFYSHVNLTPFNMGTK